MLRPSWSISLLLAAACDCSGTLFHDVAVRPLAVVEPTSITHEPLCDGTVDLVHVRNEGTAWMAVSSVVLEGSGWKLVPVTMPVQVEPGGAVDLALEAGVGTATLRIETDDERHPSFVVPLRTLPNMPPRLTFLSPTATSIVPDGRDLELAVRVEDDAAGAEVTWTAPGIGTVATAKAGPDGVARAAWSPAGRPHGAMQLVATTRDGCGIEARDEVSFCLDGTYAYEPFKLGGWQFNGSARYDAPTGTLWLTPALTNKSGSAFELSQSVGAGDVDISFGFLIGNGTGADGFSFTALDASRMTTTVGPKGCGLGYGGGVYCTSGVPLPGWSVEVDTFYNLEVDPTREPHVAFTFDGQLLEQPLWKTIAKIDDARWHQMRVRVRAPRVTVSIDDAVILDGNVQGQFDFPAYVGFTAATGGQTNEHKIQSLEVQGRYCGEGGLFPGQTAN